MTYVILDRDGVINYDSDHYIKSPEEWIAIPGSLEAIAQLNRCGFRVIVATNQSGIARGYFNYETLNEIHNKFHSELAAVGGCIEEIFFCPHHPEEGCVCRKPKPGLLHQIKEKYAINLPDTFFIGDSFTDVQAAISAGCKPILVLTSKGIRSLETNPELKNIPHFDNLEQAANYVIAKSRDKKSELFEV